MCGTETHFLLDSQVWNTIDDSKLNKTRTGLGGLSHVFSVQDLANLSQT